MNIIYFITHKTLTKENARMSLLSLKNQNFDFHWNALCIYNSHQEDINNSEIKNIIDQFGLKYDLIDFLSETNTKTLAQDIHHISCHAKKNVSDNDKILLLKSDYYLSVNFNKSINSILDNNFIFSLPIYNAKEWVLSDDIIKKSLEIDFKYVDNETYYRGSDIFEPKEEFGLHLNIKDTDDKIKFVSHCVKGDFNCHVLDGCAIKNLNIEKNDMEASWGGMGNSINSLREFRVKFLNNLDCFAIHMFHDIISKNRKEVRKDDRKNFLGQRY
jgi:hypothetical protein